MEKKDKIRLLNDDLRVHGTGWTILATRGIQDLSESVQRKIFAAIQDYTDFTEDNDPYWEHDMGFLSVDWNDVMFKIDYYDNSLSFHSEDASNPEITQRVMTVLKRSEY